MQQLPLVSLLREADSDHALTRPDLAALLLSSVVGQLI